MVEARKLEPAVLDAEQTEVGTFLVDVIASVNGPLHKPRRALFAAKRTFDLILASLALVLLAPLLVAIAAAIKIETNGPALFTQLRVGRHLRTFRILKFRTMHVGVPDVPRPIWDEASSANRRPEGNEDERVTKVGGFLRRWSLDELPQLFNILMGEMALIGPRPLTVHESILIPREALVRYSMPAGLTGLAQVTCRELIISPERFTQDIRYVHEFGIALDAKIFFLTFREVVRYATKAGAQRGGHS